MAGEVTNENEFVAVPFQAEISWDDLKKDASGLVPCIVQDYKTGQVLMLAYMNEAAYLETAATGTMCSKPQKQMAKRRNKRSFSICEISLCRL